MRLHHGPQTLRNNVSMAINPLYLDGTLNITFFYLNLNTFDIGKFNSTCQIMKMSIHKQIKKRGLNFVLLYSEINGQRESNRNVTMC